MTKKEKEIIEMLKESIPLISNGNILVIDKVTTIFIILDLIDKQQKEIEELKKENQKLYDEVTQNICENAEQDLLMEKIKNSISKDKIREKIKELKEYKKEIEEEKDNEYFTVLRCIKELEKLLEE